MNWDNLLKLKRLGDTKDRPRITQDDTRLGFEEVYRTKHRSFPFHKQTLFTPDSLTV